MWTAVQRGFVSHYDATFVAEGLRDGFKLGVDINKMRGHRQFNNYKSSIEAAVSVSKAVQERVSVFARHAADCRQNAACGHDVSSGRGVPARQHVCTYVWPAVAVAAPAHDTHGATGCCLSYRAASSQFGKRILFLHRLRCWACNGY